ncbi:CinA family protein [Marinibaculum pumilum]|uniref:CinA family protein n=1 Tax=Marinibaculum pumilum TaxID=1766165 RepID=A0ABV7KVQ4_9PROT
MTGRTAERTETLSPALPDDLEQAALDVLRRADAGGLKLATAESCTGGLLASLLTDIDGYGHVFERGFVTYGDRAKCDLLGLAQKQIDDCGAVSREVAVAMAEGAVQRSAAELAVAITGFAGPAGDGDEEGRVHLACARKGVPTVHREAHFGACGRGAIRLRAVRAALEMLQSALRV